MIRNAVLASALAGCASFAGAQEFSLSLVASTEVLDCSGGTFTISVFGDASVGTHMLGGAFGLDASDGGAYITDIDWTPADWSAFNSDEGFANDGFHGQVVFGQIVIPGIFPPTPGSELGSLIGSFQITYGQASPELMDITLVEGDPFTFQTVDAQTGVLYEADSSNLTIDGARVLLCPNPGTCSVFAFCGILAIRRRR